jgi:hypothetical protein
VTSDSPCSIGRKRGRCGIGRLKKDHGECDTLREKGSQNPMEAGELQRTRSAKWHRRSQRKEMGASGRRGSRRKKRVERGAICNF